MQDQINDLVAKWMEIDVNPETRNEIQALVDHNNYEKLYKKLGKRIQFGTAGLRSSMEAGFAHMNDVTVMQASQGLVNYLSANQCNRSIVVGYDHRHHSQRFAEITASVALTKGFTVYYLGNINVLSDVNVESYVEREYVHTPMVPFTINQTGAGAGVMVTASHNPANDNGYKVYYGNGCQIIPPVDSGIAKSIDENLIPWDDGEVWNVKRNFEKGIADGLLVSVKVEMTEKYVDTIAKKLINNKTISYPFVYTPMHGVGLEIVDRVLKDVFETSNRIPVEEQMAPSPDFPTVRFPNPEEKGALDLAIAKADELNINVVVANDPDADRFSVAVRNESGQFQQLTGNEIGFLFAVYIIETIPVGDLSQVFLLNSTVSSQILRSMADIEGFNFEDTLTGFKWIGNRALHYKKEGFTVPFAYEEAIGFMFNTVDDKDGVAALAIWLQLYEKWFATTGANPITKLHQGYEKYGWYKECNGYYKFDDLSKATKVFSDIRASYEPLKYPQLIGFFKVTSWRDLTVGFDSTTKDTIPILPIDPTSQMITATLTDETTGNSVRFTCRGSGTEPKLKVYIEGSGTNEQEATEIARLCWDTLREHWFKPEIYGLIEVV
ncbi:Phosphoglucomutase-3 [Scheffersomyces spartinae]|uniref:Phosphoglucomutase-3 n=1 Tax=Scheffersomyces spartinae TaxID=45513 RepID=A0A9P7VED4_9ASCO|nr:Phosphoglucomutase-3 [Scheffersomyces spartinae]KAG7196267.1 Phosphoglucomutase-3 [Scheffersomyces spartinae]